MKNPFKHNCNFVPYNFRSKNRNVVEAEYKCKCGKTDLKVVHRNSEYFKCFKKNLTLFN